MYTTINKSQFRDAFHNMGRGDQFSYDALGVLYDFYDEEENFDLDVIGICCDWCEYDSFQELKEAYSNILEDIDDDDIIEEFQDKTQILEVIDNNYLKGIRETRHLVRAF